MRRVMANNLKRSLSNLAAVALANGLLDAGEKEMKVKIEGYVDDDLKPMDDIEIVVRLIKKANDEAVADG